MSKYPDHSSLRDDVDDRQRNLVFPDTVRNEARLWRNLQKRPWTASTKAGLGILGVSFYSFLAAIFVAAFEEGHGWQLVLSMILFCGTIFGALAWATSRSLRSVGNTKSRKNKRSTGE